MRRNLKAALAGVLTTAVAAGGLLVGAAPSFATTTGAVPPWDPDANAAAPYGNIVFYDAQGNQVTSGPLTNPFAYAVATTPADSGSTKADLAFYNPQPATPPNPGAWTGTSESGNTTFSPASSLPAGTPADVAAFAPTYPVVAATANISSWIAGNSPSTAAGYANTIQVRLQDTLIQGTTTYWETDIGYNNTASPVTITEPAPGSGSITIPANSWVQIFPSVSSTTTALTSSKTSPQPPGTSIPLTATVSPSATGSVNFYDGSTFLANVAVTGGSATYTVTSPSNGAHSYTASFVPGTTPGDATGTNTSSASIVGGSASAALPMNIQTSTSTALSASSTSINYGDSDTFTATVTSTDNGTTSNGVAGSVQFFDGGSPMGSPVATTVSAAAPYTGTAQMSTTTLPQGSNSITATFTPSGGANGAYSTSTSPAVAVQVAAPGACQLQGSSCSDPQNLSVTINPGTLTISTPYTSATPFVLPAMTLGSDGTYFQTSAQFPDPKGNQIVVSSSLSPAQPWTLSVAATALTGAHTGATIPASGLGLTGGKLLNPAPGAGSYPATVTFSNLAADNPSTADPGPGTGLSGTPQTWAASPAADGSAIMDGTLSLFAATSSPADTYGGIITFSVS